MPVVWVAEDRTVPPGNVFVDAHRYDGSLHWSGAVFTFHILADALLVPA